MKTNLIVFLLMIIPCIVFSEETPVSISVSADAIALTVTTIKSEPVTNSATDESTNTTGDLTEEQRMEIIAKAYPDATNDVETFHEYSNRSLITGSSHRVFTKEKAEIHMYLIAFSLREACNHCASFGMITVDSNLNTLASMRYGAKGDGKYSFIDLSCDGNPQVLYEVQEVYAMASGTMKNVVFSINDGNIKKIFDAELSLFTSPKGYSGEKHSYAATMVYLECKNKTWKDIILKKRFEHYDDYCMDGKFMRDTLEKPWILKETWRFNGEVYEMIKKEGRDPFNTTIWDKFLKWFFAKFRKPLMSVKYKCV